jgi:hypothetical protein
VKRDHDRVYGIDPWTRYMWNNRVRSAPDVERVLSRGVERFETFGAFGREVFGRLFGMRPIPVHPVRPEDRIWERAHAELDELPGWEHLVRRATGDRVLGAAATVAFCDRLLDSLPEPQAQLADVEPMRERARALMRMAEGGAPEGVDVEEMLEALRGQGQAAVEAAQGYAQSVDDSALRQALRASVEAGHAAAAELDCAVGAFSGWQPGASGLGVDIEAKARLAERIRQSPKLQQLARAAGRMRRLALAKQQSPSKHAREEVADVELGSDLARVLPTELVKLTDPLLSLDFARRFVEGTLMQYRLQGRETLGRGPLIVLLDDSGSMEGDRELWAKAVTLGLVQVAAFQRRRCRIVHFDGAVRRVDEWGPRASTSRRCCPRWRRSSVVAPTSSRRCEVRSRPSPTTRAWVRPTSCSSPTGMRRWLTRIWPGSVRRAGRGASRSTAFTSATSRYRRRFAGSRTRCWRPAT